MKNKLTIIGAAGGIATGICCVTPLLTIAATAAGAVAVIEYLDVILFPLLAVFAVLFVYGLRRGSPGPGDEPA